MPGYVEIYKDKPIAWSLGNFWFSEGGGRDFFNRVGYVFELSFTDEETIDWNTYPYYSDYEHGAIREMEHLEENKWNKLIIDVQNVLEDTEIYNQWWDDLVRKKYIEYLTKYSLAPSPNVIKPVLGKFLTLFNIGNRWKLRQLNGLRCRSHREIWTQSLIKAGYDEKCD